MNFVEHRPGRFCRATFPVAILLFACLWLIACENRGDDREQAVRQSEDQAGALAAQPMRIASLSPAVSQTLVDLGLAENIVGRTPFCDSLPDDVAIVGDLLEINHEMLVRVEPTHLLVQPPAAGPSPALVALAAERGWQLLTWHLNGLRDIEQMVRDIMQIMPADMDDVRARGEQMLAKMKAIGHANEPRWTGRVLIVDSIDPVLAFGTDTYLGEFLRLFGCENAMQRTGWVELSMEDVTQLAPDGIVIVDADEQAAAEHLGGVRKLQVPAVQANRVGVLSHGDALLPSSSVVEVAAELRRIIKQFEATDS